MNNKNIGAIIITYNFDSIFNKAFEILYNQVEYITIVDNNSNEECVETIKKIENLEKVRVIYNKENYGIAKAINQGIEVLLNLKCEWIMTLDDDSIIEENYISKMIDIENSVGKNNIGAICPNIYDVNLKEYMYSKEKGYSKINKSIQSGTIFNSDIFNKIGLFNEDLFIYYVDEEYFEKIRVAGYGVFRVNNAIIYHSDGCMTKKKILWKKFDFNTRPYYAIYYRARNGVYMVKNYGVNYLKDIFRDPIKIVLYEQDKCKKIRYYIKGIIDGISNRLGVMIESKKS